MKNLGMCYSSIRLKIAMENLIKIIVAALLLLCVADMPYGYYQMVRFVAMLGFAILAYKSYERRAGIACIIYIGLALLFQPLAKISLGRVLWNIVDILVGIGLVATVFLKAKTGNNGSSRP